MLFSLLYGCLIFHGSTVRFIDIFFICCKNLMSQEVGNLQLTQFQWIKNLENSDRCDFCKRQIAWNAIAYVDN